MKRFIHAAISAFIPMSAHGADVQDVYGLCISEAKDGKT